MKKKSKFKTIRNVIIILILAGLVVFYFFHISNRSSSIKEKSYKQQVEKIISMDLQKDYPETLDAVMNLYAEMVRCLINASIKEDQIVMLVDQMRMLMDDELLANNARETHILNQIEEIEQYKKLKRVMMGYEVTQNNDVDKPIVEVKFSFSQNKIQNETIEEFLLRRDQDERWKIVGWKIKK